MKNPKLMYKPEDKPYTEDINDLIEADIVKGGAGSGIKGHLTIKDYKIHERMKDAAKRGDLNKLRGAESHFKEQRQAAKRAGLKEHEEHYKKLHHEAINHVMGRLDAGSRDMKKCQDELNELEKGGEGSGKRGHMSNRQPMPGSGAILEKLRALRVKAKMENDPKKKEKHFNEIKEHIAHYERLNPHMAKSEDFEKGGEGSGSKGHQTHHYEPAKIPGYKFTHSEHTDNAPVPNVTHHYDSEGSGNSKQEQLHDHAQKHHGNLTHETGMVSRKIMGSQLSQDQKTGKNKFSITLKKK